MLVCKWLESKRELPKNQCTLRRNLEEIEICLYLRGVNAILML